ncbi:MAG TPA: GNAT family N-acetyltransferase [Gaiellaceae bacterium]|nr:GNAT family N-acetyltransferase [Gaiellaceae bacterium]
MIRPATPDDLPLVRELWRAFEAEIPEPAWHDDELEQDLEWLATVVEKETVLLGDDVGLAVALMKGSRLGFLEMVYVRPQARGTGLARELTREAASRLRERGAEVLELEVLAPNAQARTMYERWGFETSELTLAAPIAALEQRLGERPSGPTFGSVHVQTDDVEKVRRDAVKVLRAEPDVVLGSGWVRVRSDATDADPARLKTLARELSYTSASVVLSLGVEQGAVVRYHLFDRGADVDEYLSVPEYYGPLPPGDVIALGSNPRVASRLTGADPQRVREVARTAPTPDELPPAQELYEQIADIFGVTT